MSHCAARSTALTWLRLYLPVELGSGVCGGEGGDEKYGGLGGVQRVYVCAHAHSRG